MKMYHKLAIGVTAMILAITPYYSAKANVIAKYQASIINSREKQIEVNDYVYTTSRLNIRTNASINSEILFTAEVGSKLHRVSINVNPGWDMIIINNKNYYISNDFITTQAPQNIARSIEEQLEDSYISARDLKYMSAIIFAEAGNQCLAGQQAVGIVVMNRVKSDIYANTVYDVIYEPGQFAPVDDGNLNEALALYESGKLPNEAIEAAKYALSGNTAVHYNNQSYNLKDCLYFSIYINGCRFQIGDHMFR